MVLVLLVIAGVLTGGIVGLIIGLVISLIRLVFLILWLVLKPRHGITVTIEGDGDGEPLRAGVRRLPPSPSRRTGTTLSGRHRRQGHAHYPSSSNWSSRGRA
jgi:hypothetical protein